MKRGRKHSHLVLSDPVGVLVGSAAGGLADHVNRAGQLRMSYKPVPPPEVNALFTRLVGAKKRRFKK